MLSSLLTVSPTCLCQSMLPPVEDSPRLGITSFVVPADSSPEGEVGLVGGEVDGKGFAGVGEIELLSGVGELPHSDVCAWADEAGPPADRAQAAIRHDASMMRGRRFRTVLDMVLLWRQVQVASLNHKIAR